MGPNPRISAGSTVASSWLRLFRGTKGKKHDADLKKSLPTLDIGSHINARPELLLEAVSARPWFGVGSDGTPHHSTKPAVRFIAVYPRRANVRSH